MNYVIFNMGPKLYEIQIVCENSRAIEAFVIHEIHKSATLSQVTGSYSGQTKAQVDCVCNSREYVQLREFIRDQGVDCFIKVFPLTHVFGRTRTSTGSAIKIWNKKKDGPHCGPSFVCLSSSPEPSGCRCE